MIFSLEEGASDLGEFYILANVNRLGLLFIE